MDTNQFKQIIINKNRGWRGLAEIIVYDNSVRPMETQLKMIFSFSQPVWEDLIKRNLIVMQDNKYYYVITFSNDGSLPRPDQQRSVLIKNFLGSVTNVNKYLKSEWSKASGNDWAAIVHFMKNRNNHTTSDWNCIGVRVIPEI